jgi:hypothetical protein
MLELSLALEWPLAELERLTPAELATVVDILDERARARA